MHFKTVVFLFLLSFFTTLKAQYKPFLYGTSEVPQSLLINPSTPVSFQKHLGIPLFSQISLHVGNKGFTAFNLFEENATTSFSNRLRTVVRNLENTDYLALNQQLEIISLGWRTQSDIYFSGGIYQETDFIFYYPKDILTLAVEGNADYLGYAFDLGEIKFEANMLAVYHFGATKEVLPNLYLGARAKIYSSIFDISSTANEGFFVTELNPTNPNELQSRAEANLLVKTAGITSLSDGGNTVGKQISNGIFLGGNLGLGLDFGATYFPLENVKVVAGIQDLGTIQYSKNVEAYRIQGADVVDGVEFLYPTDGVIPYYEDLEDRIEASFPLDTLSGTYSRNRPLKMNAAVEVGIGEALSNGACDCLNMDGDLASRDRVGLQFFSVKRPRQLQYALSAFYYRRINDILSAKLTYTVDTFSKNNIGLGLSSQFKNVNVFLALENILQYGNLAKANQVGLAFGVNLILIE